MEDGNSKLEWLRLGLNCQFGVTIHVREPSDRSGCLAGIMKATLQQEFPQLVASRTVSPEDLAVGDYIAITRYVIEAPSFFWCCDETIRQREELAQIWLMPKDIQPPMKVLEVCLPFVLTKTVDRRHKLLDLRMLQLVRVDPRYGRKVRKLVRKNKA